MLADCDDLHSAVQAVDAVRPDLVVTDLHLTGPDGMALIDHLRHTPPSQLIPVIVLVPRDAELPEFDVSARVAALCHPASTGGLATAVDALLAEVELQGRKRTPGGAGAH